jgi:fumarate reductase subunit D
MAKSNEPLFWSLFSAGGVVAAFFVPVTLILTGVAVPAGWIKEDDLLPLVRHPLTRVYLFVLISLPLFHWAHRFRYVAADLGLKVLGVVLPIVCYGAAILGTALAAYVLLRL